MSRYALDPPDEDRYEPKPMEDSDVPDFDALNPPIGRLCKLCGYSIADHTGTFLICPGRSYQQFEKNLDPPIDPAEHAAHALIDALATLEKEIASNFELERAWVLKHMLARAWDQIEQVNTQAMNKIDVILERRR